MICAEEKRAENTHESVAATQNFEIAMEPGYICSAITGLLPLDFQLPLINQKVFLSFQNLLCSLLFYLTVIVRSGLFINYHCKISPIIQLLSKKNFRGKGSRITFAPVIPYHCFLVA